MRLLLRRIRVNSAAPVVEEIAARLCNFGKTNGSKHRFVVGGSP
jgi:hypothetical protein